MTLCSPHEYKAGSSDPAFFYPTGRMKILLAYISGSRDRRDPFINLLPAGLCYLHASLLEAGFDSVLANFSGWSETAIMEQLAVIRPAVIGISQWTHNRHASLDLAHLARRALPKCTIIMGGGHATFRYLELLSPGSPVDVVVIGEGEETLLELVACRRNGGRWDHVPGIAHRLGGEIVTTPPRPPLPDLDRLPFSTLHLDHSIGVDQELQAEFIVTSRGCPSACTFCSSPGFWPRRVRFRSPAQIVDEILWLRQQYGLIYFSLRDDTFTADRKRTIDMCRLLIEREAHVLWNCQSRVTVLDREVLVWMKRAGCEGIQLGIESGSPRILGFLGKRITPVQVEEAARLIRGVGINLSVYLISDIPGETEEDVQATIALMRRIRPDDGYVSPLAYYPGTRLFDEAVAAGRVAGDIFEASRAAALYAGERPGKNSRRLLGALSRQKAGDGQRFERQKRELGYCAVTNVLAGEWYRQQGDGAAAEREFSEITAKEPDHPWGWFLLGELYAELGEKVKARRCYLRVLATVPRHRPSLVGAKTKRGH